MSWIEYLFIGIGVVLAVNLIHVLFIPGGKKRKKRRVKDKGQGSPQKDWEATAQRLETHIYTLRHKIESKDKVINQKDKQAVLEKAKVEKLQDQLNQAGRWQKKEENNYSKMSGELKGFKAEFEKVQGQYVSAHGENIELKKELSTTTDVCKRLGEDKRDVELTLNQLREKYEKLQAEAVILKRECNELKKKKDDTAWVAKSEYLVLERKLKEKEKQFDRLNRRLCKESE